MDVDEDDDFYAPEEGDTPNDAQQAEVRPETEGKPPQMEEDLEEGEEEEDEEEEEDDDSDIDIITERKDGSKAAPPPQARYNEIRNIPQRIGSSEVATKGAVAKKESAPKSTLSGADLPAVATSKIDVNAKPVYEPAGKPITQVNIDEDLSEHDKPWRRPGTDISDYFNYGFDEFTWALYAAKQDSLRSEFDQDKIALNQKKMLEDMNMMMMGGGMPGMPGMPAAGAGLEGMPPEMQQMMQQMMASGMDPSQADPAAMFAAMTGGQGVAGAAQGNQGQSFGGQFGQGQQNYGYDQGLGQSQGQGQGGGGGGGGGGGRGNFRGRGRGHRNW